MNLKMASTKLGKWSEIPRRSQNKTLIFPTKQTKNRVIQFFPLFLCREMATLDRIAKNGANEMTL